MKGDDENSVWLPNQLRLSMLVVPIYKYVQMGRSLST